LLASTLGDLTSTKKTLKNLPSWKTTLPSPCVQDAQHKNNKSESLGVSSQHSSVCERQCDHHEETLSGELCKQSLITLVTSSCMQSQGTVTKSDVA